jgi:hypothetical protein
MDNVQKHNTCSVNGLLQIKFHVRLIMLKVKITE